MADLLAEHLARLEREREDADTRYNDALTALDQALSSRPDVPHPPPAYDDGKLEEINRSWNLLPNGEPAIDGSFKGRLRGFIWRLVGPAFATQQRFNAALVEHLNRNVAAHREAERAIHSLIALSTARAEARIHFESRLIQLLQTVTLYVDTKDRATAGGQQVLNAGLGAVTDTWMKHWESLSTREARVMAGLAATDQSMEDIRRTATLAQQTALALKREVEKLLAGTTGTSGTTGDRKALTPSSSSALKTENVDSASALHSPVVPVVPVAPVVPDAPNLDAFKYLGFEDQFRGSVDDIRQRLTEYVPLFEGQSDVLDIGCGRGEFLELLGARGISARGLDSNLAMVEASRARGLDVALGDALTYVDGLADASIGGVFAAQVVEHLPPDYLSRLLETAAHKIRPGGLIVLETINVASWLAFFESYVRDLTHVRPLHPETLQYLVRVSGFHDVRIEFKSPVAETVRLERLAPALPDTSLDLRAAVDTMNENVDRLNAKLFNFQDYAVIGRT